MASGQLTLDVSSGVMKGRYSDLRNALQLALEPRQEAGAPGSNIPSHDVYAAMPGGQLSLCGAAWTKTVQKDGPTKGKKFFSITIDDPSFQTSLNLTAFPARDDKGAMIPNEFSVFWERPNRVAAA